MSYNTVKEGIADNLAWNPDSLSPEQFHKIRRSINKALREIWNVDFWRTITLIEQRRFEPVWQFGYVNPIGTRVYHIGSKDYYVTLAETDTEPASWNGTKWVLNPKWALLRTSITADPWKFETQYAIGDQVASTFNGYVYQAHEVPPMGEHPQDTPASWGRVPLFLPSVLYLQQYYPRIDRVFQVFADDPRTTRGARKVDFRVGRTGVEFFDLAVKEPWIVYRTRAHQFEGSYWDPTATYIAAQPADLSGDITLGFTPESEVPIVLTEFYPAANINELLAQPSSDNFRFAVVLFSTAGDGSAGEWYYDAESFEEDNLATVRIPADRIDSQPGRWFKL